jgi:hypothetical protein
MSMNTLKAQLFSVEEAGRLLGGISPWTLRKHVAAHNVKVTRIGRRVLLTTEEVERIRRDGLPSLGQLRKPEPALPTVSSEKFVASSKTAGDSFSNQTQSGEEK